MDEDTNFLSYIDLLSSALGANLLLMLILSVQVQNEDNPLVPPVERQVWLELRAKDASLPVTFALVTSGSGREPKITRRRVQAGEVVEVLLDAAQPPPETHFHVKVRTEALEQVRALAHRPEFDLLADPTIFGEVKEDPTFQEFSRQLEKLRRQTDLSSSLAHFGDTCAAVRERLEVLRAKIPPLTVRRLERFLAEASALLENPVPADGETGALAVELLFSAPDEKEPRRLEFKLRPGQDALRVRPPSGSAAWRMEVVPHAGHPDNKEAK